MPDEIKQRLQESADKCMKSYEAWSGDKKSADARETLQESVHELRKVASRLEIEVALSERDQTAQKPMPIPHHRDAKGRHQKPEAGNEAEGNTEKKSSKPRSKAAPKKKEESEEKAG